MLTAPTLYLTNWSSVRRDPGPRTWTIMARPRAWEHGAGRVAPLTPSGDALALLGYALAERKAGRDSSDAMCCYRAAYEAQLDAEAHLLRPGVLSASLPSGEGVLLEDGDTLCCACSAEDARQGRCHRAWAAGRLAAAGWRVVLDGVEVGADAPSSPETPSHALSLWPEWAHAILHYGKRVENRTWRLPPQWIGRRVYLHAGASVGRAERLRRWEGIEMMAMMAGADCPDSPPEIVCGALIGILHLTACDAPHEGDLGGWRVAEQFGWRFEFEPLPKPIAARGALGFWRVAT